MPLLDPIPSPVLHADFTTLEWEPLLALVAVNAPADQRATWFALIASLMSLAIVASQLLTKYLNLIFPIDRGAYDALPGLVVAVIAIAVLLPLGAVLALRRRM